MMFQQKRGQRGDWGMRGAFRMAAGCCWRGMCRNSRGQLGFEYLVIAGMILVVVLPFLAYSLTSTNALFSTEGATASLHNLAQATETAMNLGPGNAVSVSLSPVFQKVEVKGGGIFMGTLKNGQTITAKATANVQPDQTIVSRQAGVANNNGQALVFDAPEIIKLEPESAQRGATVTVRGHYFTSDSTITLNKKTTAATYVSDTVMQFTVPSWAEDGPNGVRVVRHVGSNVMFLTVTGMGGQTG